MPARLRRSERKEQTRTELVAAARRVFLRRGFHQASLEEITEEAGYTKGAVYSNFAGKDELFLAVLDEQLTRRAGDQIARMRAADSFESGLRAAGRDMGEASAQDPEWLPVLIEFYTHASRDEQLRKQVADRHDQMLDEYAAMLDEVAPRNGVAFTLPTREVARSAAALSRGLALERLLHPDAAPAEMFEHTFATHVMGLTRSRADAESRTR